ncbi:ATP-binding cassette domain-containing protein [Nesterenkonia massiliensis]|uniref:ATP-binding cassette domain-containing protein n=1 Tax=Nesterenkonia massiliensis TaxID=1232429 RepID=A0ABT2HMR9_9MICC|nr:oligopeptide/dipeptide ABC transporter ATP-binding protein [Nesterenkonia massiliensis]MCT1605979.1 ATP-binding cassette domain-containing protein [Nesterenkonia massiliensis]
MSTLTLSTSPEQKPQELSGEHPTEPAVLEVKNLTKEFAVSKTVSFPAVDDVSFSLQQGETLSVVGESGCGKSTLGRCIVRGIDATSGEVIYTPQEGSEVDFLSLKGRQLKKVRKDIQMIFQDPHSSLDPRQTVFDIIAEPLKATTRIPQAELRRRVREIAEKVGLDPSHLRRYPHSFSGGQRQRIGIARALVTRPSVIVADEAVSALDVSIQAQIINLLRDLQEELGVTYLFIAHDLSIVEYISDRVAVMYLGRIVELAPTDSLFATPKHPYTEVLLSAVPQPDPDVRRQRIVPKGEVPSPADRPKGCLFANRCAYATELCEEKAPALQETAPGHFSACHYASQLQLKGLAQLEITGAEDHTG